MPDLEKTTLYDAYALGLERIDRAWKKVMACHVDAAHCNNASKEYREAKDALESAERAMWRLKTAIADMRE